MKIKYIIKMSCLYGSVGDAKTKGHRKSTLSRFYLNGIYGKINKKEYEEDIKKFNNAKTKEEAERIRSELRLYYGFLPPAAINPLLPREREIIEFMKKENIQDEKLKQLINDYYETEEYENLYKINKPLLQHIIKEFKRINPDIKNSLLD